MEPSLSDIFAAEVLKPPVLEYTARTRVIYRGKHKISAVKAFRDVTGTTLKSAKNAVQWQGGICLPKAQFNVVLDRYYDYLKMNNQHDEASGWEYMDYPDPVEV